MIFFTHLHIVFSLPYPRRDFGAKLLSSVIENSKSVMCAYSRREIVLNTIELLIVVANLADQLIIYFIVKESSHNNESTQQRLFFVLVRSTKLVIVPSLLLAMELILHIIMIFLPLFQKDQDEERRNTNKTKKQHEVFKVIRRFLKS